MEEWRAVLVDSLAMSLLNGHELAVGDFESDDAGGCYLTKKGLAVFLNKMEKKMQTSIRYLHYLDYPVTFRRALGFQAGRLAKAIEAEDAALYDPILIR
jgi:CRISPR-associated protein Cas1